MQNTIYISKHENNDERTNINKLFEIISQYKKNINIFSILDKIYY